MKTPRAAGPTWEWTSAKGRAKVVRTLDHPRPGRISEFKVVCMLCDKILRPELGQIHEIGNAMRLAPWSHRQRGKPPPPTHRLVAADEREEVRRRFGRTFRELSSCSPPSAAAQSYEPTREHWSHRRRWQPESTYLLATTRIAAMCPGTGRRARALCLRVPARQNWLPPEPEKHTVQWWDRWEPKA